MPLFQSALTQTSVEDIDGEMSRTKEHAQKKITSKVWNYIESRFDRDNWFGSVILIQSWIKGYNRLRGSLVREVHGEKQPDHLRAVASTISLLGYTWSFVSKRGAKFPDGDTVPQRMANAILHPQESSNQFEFLIFLPGTLLSIFNNVQQGLKAYGIGLKQGEKAYTPEKVRLYMGLLSVSWQACVGYGHFRKRDEKLPEKEHKPVKPGFIGIIQKVWRHDRVLFIGSLLNITMPFVSVVEGLNKTSTSRKEAIYILRDSFIGIAGTAAYNFYIFQRIAKSNFGNKENKQEIEPKVESAENNHIENAGSKAIEQTQGNFPQTGFLKEILAQKQAIQRPAKNQPHVSFVQQLSSPSVPELSR